MPVSAETLRLLMDAGVEGDELLRIVESIDAQQAPERSAGAVRQARYRANKKAQTVTGDVTSDVTQSVTPRVHVEDNPSNLEITGKGRKKTTREDLTDFEAELFKLLDADRVHALVAVRKHKGGKLNGHSARLLVAKINACGLSPAQAADTMALRNWISIEAEWLKRDLPKPHSTASPAKPKKQTLATMWHDEARQHGIIDDPSSPPNGRVVPSLPAGQNQSPGVARRYAGT
jgi:hypothetical protein